MHDTKLTVWQHSIGFFVTLFILWGFYRYLFRFPVIFEEVVLKGILFGGVTFLAAYKARWSFRDLGISTQNLRVGVQLGIILGMSLGFVGQIGNLLRHQEFQFSNFGLNPESFGTFLILSIVTAFWEQLFFSGYLLPRLKGVIQDDGIRSWIVAVLFTLIHIPALVLVQQLSIAQLLLSCVLLLLLQMACNTLRLRYGNLAAPILAHALWGVTVYLFK